MTPKSIAAALLSLAPLALSFGPSAFANNNVDHEKFEACVSQNGGMLPALTDDQKTAKSDCWKNNKNDKSAVKQCIQALNLPEPDAKTKAAIQTCRSESKKSNQGGTAPHKDGMGGAD
jgi:hypothetical protein